MKKIPVRQLGKTDPEKFKIRRVQDIMGEEDLVQDLHRHDFFFLLALEKGRGYHEIDFTSYKIADNSIFVLRPGQVHKLELKKDSTGFLLEFNSAFYHPKDKLSSQRLLKASNRNFCLPGKSRFDKLLAILESMYNEYNDKQEAYLDSIRANLDIFFIEYVRQSLHPRGLEIKTNSYTQERFEEFLDLLDKNIATHKQVGLYAGMMNLSPYQLNAITKSSIDKTASEVINDQIILEAKRYLLATSSQVKDIADLLGYEDPSYFIRFFRKHTGHSPDAYRRNSS